MKDPGADRRYRGVAPELVAELLRFRERFAYRETQTAGWHWRYLDTAAGESTVLLLTGALGAAEMSWRTIEHLALRHRVLAPDYPAVDTMAELTDGLAAILDRERMESAHVVGGSYGGFVAQVFVRRHPARSASLVLSHTLVPEPAAASRLRSAERWVRWLPSPALRTVFRLRLGRLFPKAGPPELALSRALFNEILDDRLSKAGILSMMRRVTDLAASYHFTPRDLDAWPGRVLLLMADDDPATPEPVRRALLALYPGAESCVFSGTGHATAVLKQEEYFAAMDRFLAETPSPGQRA
jgi:pimeloyl-ACP methyl ester carboxylesterase